MPRIFVSYRRDDAAMATGRISDHLRRKFGPEPVFQDVSHIPLGVDFGANVEQEIAKCDIMLAIIGRKWVSITDERGQRHLDSPDDFVRLEVEAALKRDIPVVPVLVEGARMPSPGELPESIQQLAFLSQWHRRAV